MAGISGTHSDTSPSDESSRGMRRSTTTTDDDDYEVSHKRFLREASSSTSESKCSDVEMKIVPEVLVCTVKPVLREKEYIFRTCKPLPWVESTREVKKEGPLKFSITVRFASSPAAVTESPVVDLTLSDSDDETIYELSTDSEEIRDESEEVVINSDASKAIIKPVVELENMGYEPKMDNVGFKKPEGQVEMVNVAYDPVIDDVGFKKPESQEQMVNVGYDTEVNNVGFKKSEVEMVNVGYDPEIDDVGFKKPESLMQMVNVGYDTEVNNAGFKKPEGQVEMVNVWPDTQIGNVGVNKPDSQVEMVNVGYDPEIDDVQFTRPAKPENYPVSWERGYQDIFAQFSREVQHGNNPPLYGSGQGNYLLHSDGGREVIAHFTREIQLGNFPPASLGNEEAIAHLFRDIREEYDPISYEPLNEPLAQQGYFNQVAHSEAEYKDPDKQADISEVKQVAAVYPFKEAKYEESIDVGTLDLTEEDIVDKRYFAGGDIKQQAINKIYGPIAEHRTTTQSEDDAERGASPVRKKAYRYRTGKRFGRGRKRSRKSYRKTNTVKAKQEAVAVEPKQEAVAVEPKQEAVAVEPKQEAVAVEPKQEAVAVEPKQEAVAVEPGDFRNISMEKVANNLLFPCKHKLTGCRLSLALNNKAEHEEVCEFRPYACPCPGTSCCWTGQLEEVMDHLDRAHKNILTLKGEDIVFLATEINLPGAVDWVMMQSCFGHHFMLILAKQEKCVGHTQFFAIVQLIGSRKQAEHFAYRLELNGNRRRLTWEAMPRSSHEGVATAIMGSDCLVFDTSIAQLFTDHNNLSINVTISVVC